MIAKVLRWAAFALVVGVALFVGWRTWQARRASALPAGIVSGNGRIESIQVDVTAKYVGRVVKLLAQEGDLVEPGQTLVVMDTLELESQLARAKAEVAEAEEATAQVRSDIVAAESNARFAEQKFARGQNLIGKGMIPREEYEQLRAQRDAQKATVAAQEAKLRANLKSIDAAASEARRIQVQIDDSTLKSPVRGRVLYRLAELGEVLAAGGKAMTLIDLGDIYMEIYLPSQEAARVRIGAEARIVLDALPGFAGRAKVSFVSPETQFTPKSVETRSERDKLMFRIKLRVPRELLEPHIEKVKTGLRGVGYVRLDDATPWPPFLEKRFPGAVDAPKPAPAAESKPEPSPEVPKS